MTSAYDAPHGVEKRETAQACKGEYPPTDSFRAYVEQFLAPSLRPGDTVVIDNLGSHTVKGVREAIEAAGARLLFLPPYSPDMNPIEQFFAKLKAVLRTAARRTVDGLWNGIGSALDAFSPGECRNDIANCRSSHP